MESTLAHEMVHAFDHCRFKFDYKNLKHIACSEVHQGMDEVNNRFGQWRYRENVDFWMRLSIICSPGGMGLRILLGLIDGCRFVTGSALLTQGMCETTGGDFPYGA